MEIWQAALEDKLRQCEERSMLTSTAFLDPAQCAAAERLFSHAKHLLYGGYDDAERRVMVFLPDYFDALPAEDDPLALLRVSIPKGSRELTHRDYLGSILALGVDRSVVGDILVRPDGADIIVLAGMADYFLSNYVQAGRTSLSVSRQPISELLFSETVIKSKKDTVASLRLDNIVSSAFDLSRAKAQEAIKGGLVFADSLQCCKPDAAVREGEKIVLRGKGKAILSEIGKTTRKDRIFITLDLYR